MSWSRQRGKRRFAKKVSSEFREHWIFRFGSTDVKLAYRSGVNSTCGCREQRERAKDLCKAFGMEPIAWKGLAKICPVHMIIDDGK